METTVYYPATNKAQANRIAKVAKSITGQELTIQKDGRNYKVISHGGITFGLLRSISQYLDAGVSVRELSKATVNH
jgi:hypothetical protein